MRPMMRDVGEEELRLRRDEMARRSKRLARRAELQIIVVLVVALLLLHVQAQVTDRYFGLTVSEVETANVVLVFAILVIGAAIVVRKILREIHQARDLGLVCPYCNRAWIGRELDRVLIKRTCVGCGRLVLHDTP